MQILESVVNNRKSKMLTGFSRSGYGGSPLFRHGRTTLPAYREHLLYRVTSTEQGKPVLLPARGRSRGCVGSMGQDYLTGNGADFAMVFKLENICGTDVGSNANDVGASRWCSFPHDGGFSSTAVRVGRRPVSRRLYLMLNTAASSFFRGALSNARAG